MQAQQPIDTGQEQMSPEQAMMMQQQGGQMSPEQMAAAELQQQEGQQYAYGGKLYPDGGTLGRYTPYFQNMTVDEVLGQIWDTMSKDDTRRIGSRNDFIAANRQMASEGWDDYDDVLKNVYWSNNPRAKNSQWWIDSADKVHREYKPIDFGNIKATKGKTGRNGTFSKQFFIDKDPVYRQLNDTQKQYTGNALGEALESIKDYKDDTDYLVNNWNSDFTKEWLGSMAENGSVAANELVKYNKETGKWEYKDKLGNEDLTSELIKKTIRANREDATPANANNKQGSATGMFHASHERADKWEDRYWRENPDGTYEIMTGKPDMNEYELINSTPYGVTVQDKNYNDYYVKAKGNASTGSANGNNTTEYMTVGWEPKTNWTDYTLGMLPGLTGLAFQIGQGKPDTSGLDAAEAYAERYSGIMAPPHLTHGYIQPAIIDPRVRENTMNARRLGTNRVLRNTGPSPSQAANILISDANYMGQMGLQGMQDWLANRQQEQQAAAFNRETNTTNANILNATDQFNAQMQANAARSIADMKYRVALDKINQDNAYKAGILGNIGSIFTGLNEARKQQNINNQRDILLASGVFGETNPFLENYYGISKVDPETGQVVRGYKTGWYYRTNPKTGKPEYSEKPFACGGKIKKNKRKGYTY